MMTTVTPPMSGSVARAMHGRSRRLFVAGMAGAHIAGVPCLVAFGIANGAVGLASAAVAWACVLFFYGVGQWLVFRFSTADPRTLFAVALISFGVRSALLGAVLVACLELIGPGRLDDVAMVVTATASLVGWLACEIVTWGRLRIPVYDLPGSVT